jgi:hypothetical protein
MLLVSMLSATAVQQHLLLGCQPLAAVLVLLGKVRVPHTGVELHEGAATAHCSLVWSWLACDRTDPD